MGESEGPQPADWPWIRIYRHTRALGVLCSFVSMMFAGVIGINRNSDDPSLADSPLTVMIYMNVDHATPELLKQFNEKYQRHVIMWSILGLGLGTATDRLNQKLVTAVFYVCQIVGCVCLFLSNNIGGPTMNPLVLETANQWFPWLNMGKYGFRPIFGLMLEDFGISLLCMMNVWAGYCFDGYGQLFPKYTGMVMNIIAWGQVVGCSFFSSVLSTIRWLTYDSTFLTCFLLLSFMTLVGLVHWLTTPLAYDPYVPTPWGPWRGVSLFKATRGFRGAKIEELTKHGVNEHGPLTKTGSKHWNTVVTTTKKTVRPGNELVTVTEVDDEYLDSSDVSSCSSLDLESISNLKCFKLAVPVNGIKVKVDIPEYQPNLQLMEKPPTYMLGISGLLRTKSFLWFFLMYACMSFFSAYMFQALPAILLEKLQNQSDVDHYLELFSVNSESRLSTIIPILMFGYAFDCYMSLGMAIVLMVYTTAPVLLTLGYYLPKSYQEFNFIIYTIVLYNGSPLVQVFGAHLFGFFRLGFLQGFFGFLDGLSYAGATTLVAKNPMTHLIERWADKGVIMHRTLLISIVTTTLASTFGFFLYCSVTRSRESTKPPIRITGSIRYETV